MADQAQQQTLAQQAHANDALKRNRTQAKSCEYFRGYG